MTVKRREDLEAPPDTLAGLSDSQRKISVRKPVYVLTDVQQHVISASIGGLNLATNSAVESLQDELRWRLRDVCNFICCLERHHYRYSEWCVGSGPGAKIIYPSDVYIMGFSKVTGKEWQKQNPWNYLKFSFSAENNTIEIFSIHPER
jgi:hypothetical protein